jgi:hypothetical protein
MKIKPYYKVIYFLVLIFILSSCDSKSSKKVEMLSYLNEKIEENKHLCENIISLLNEYDKPNDYKVIDFNKADLINLSIFDDYLASNNSKSEEISGDVDFEQFLFVLNDDEKFNPKDSFIIKGRYYGDNSRELLDAIEAYKYSQNYIKEVCENEYYNVSRIKDRIDRNFEKLNKVHYIAFIKYVYVVKPELSESKGDYDSGLVKAKVFLYKTHDKSLSKEFIVFADNSDRITYKSFDYKGQILADLVNNVIYKVKCKI